MSLLRDRLNRLAKRGAAGEATAGESVLQTSTAEEEGMDDWRGIGAELASNEAGCFIRRVRTYAASDRHGSVQMVLTESGVRSLGLLSSQGNASTCRIEGILFLDTETTGLGVGAGNVPFMIGLGYYRSDGGLTVEQLFIRNPAEEAAALRHLQPVLDRCDQLVTYNGRSFDWPVLKNRYVLHRLPPPPEPGQIDLLYPSRRLWKDTLPSCRLSAVEEGKLGFVRQDDVPGSMAPVHYVQFLSTGRVSDISGVFQHNELDIVSLVGLATMMAQWAEGECPWDRMEPVELVRLALWYESMRRDEQALDAIRRLQAAARADRLKVALAAAALLKRLRRYDEAAAYWHEYVDCAGFGSLVIEPLVELAMFYEHKRKDVVEALRWAELAYDRTVKRKSLSRRTGESAAVQLAELERRCNRLRAKLGSRRDGPTSSWRTGDLKPAQLTFGDLLQL